MIQRVRYTASCVLDTPLSPLRLIMALPLLRHFQIVALQFGCNAIDMHTNGEGKRFSRMIKRGPYLCASTTTSWQG